MVSTFGTLNAIPSSEQADLAWHLVDLDKVEKTRRKKSANKSSVVNARHRRGQTEGNTRHSIFSIRSRSFTTSNMSTGSGISPLATIESQEPGYLNSEPTNPESGWSDSDQSDSQTKRWVEKGSKMLRKQNSIFTLNSSKRSSLVEESDEAGEQHPRLRPRGNNKHSKTSSITTGGRPLRPSISTPFDFRHLTHTQAHHFGDLHNASHQRLATEFSAIRASQAPQYDLQGIRTEDLRSPTSGSSSPRYHDPVTPPPSSPTRCHASRFNSGLTIKAPRKLSYSRSIDTFSHPSPRMYKNPHSPTTPPARGSPLITTNPAPDFFSDIHHATPSERELLSQCHLSADDPNSTSIPPGASAERQADNNFHNGELPQAITTSDEIALTLKPSTGRRSGLALADVPEEDELHSAKRPSTQSSRPATGDSPLRHATSFPSNNPSPSRDSALQPRRSLRFSGVMPVESPRSGNTMTLFENLSNVDTLLQRRMSRGISTDVNGTDPSWEDDIDYCYHHEAEADCDFEWDCISMDKTLTVDESPSNIQPSLDISQENSQPLSKTYEKLESSKGPQDLAIASTATHTDGHDLPRLETSLPELDFSATSSAKSSMASLRGPITPLQQLPSPTKVKPSLQPSKSTDAAYLESSFSASHDESLSWTQEGSFYKVPSWDHAMDFNYPFNNLSLSGSSKGASARNGRPALGTHHSTESIMLSNSASASRTRRNTSSSSGFPELICSKNYRQQANIVAEQIADRMAALAVATASTNTNDLARPSKICTNVSSDSNTCDAHDQENDDVLVMLPAPRPNDKEMSVAAFANKLRSNSVTSSTSGSSSMRTSRISYSLFPSNSISRP